LIQPKISSTRLRIFKLTSLPANNECYRDIYVRVFLKNKELDEKAV
jgi:hypothetical protein